MTTLWIPYKVNDEGSYFLPIDMGDRVLRSSQDALDWLRDEQIMTHPELNGQRIDIIEVEQDT